MAKSSATTVEQYLEELPPERREVIAGVRDVILRNLPEGYREAMHWGMICYQIPLERYPRTYNGEPLCPVALAAQKIHCALYLMAVYADPQQEAWLKEAFQKAGKRLDMGKSCLRFRSLDALPLDVIGQLVARTPPEAYIARYEELQKR